MTRAVVLSAVRTPVVSVVCASHDRPEYVGEASRLDATVKPFVGKYCVACHSGAQPTAQFDLKSYEVTRSFEALLVQQRAQRLETVVELGTELMPGGQIEPVGDHLLPHGAPPRPVA